MGEQAKEPDRSDYVEVDPTGRYGRYNEILGKGASKTVYRAFDEYEGIEVAWNQVKLHDFLQSPEELERLYCEIHLLKTLKHKNIMKFYTSWVDTSKRNINFVTEMFTSGTLRQYRQKHRKVSIRAVKHWCRQILKGLLYLHSHDPPVIHRDLKCDNIFINGNQGVVKIGDLGLAAIRRKSHVAHCVGTPEFMAPEVYEEQYNELVDIYSFGMCVLEMVTFEYPYSECTHPAQIYKKVISGMKPDALYKVQDPEVREFVEKCLATVSRRLPASELLKDHFLQVDDYNPTSGEENFCELGGIPRQPSLTAHTSNGHLLGNGFLDDIPPEIDNEWEFDTSESTSHGVEIANGYKDQHLSNVDITIKGWRKEDDSIYLRLRITDKQGQVRNIYFIFYVEIDTALSVATEMVEELDITNYDATQIAEMIDSEISTLVPDWRPGPGIEETPGRAAASVCHDCASDHSSYGSLVDFHPLTSSPAAPSLPDLRCSRRRCAASMHGRFGEVTYRVDESEQCLTEGAPVLSSTQSDGTSRESQVDDEIEKVVVPSKIETQQDINNVKPSTRMPLGQLCCDTDCEQCLDISERGHRTPPTSLTNYQSEIQQELKWLRAEYQMELRDYLIKKIGGAQRPLRASPPVDGVDCIVSESFPSTPTYGSNSRTLKSLIMDNASSSHCFYDSMLSDSPSRSNTFDGLFGHSRPSLELQRVQSCEANADSSPEFYTAKNFYAGMRLASCLPRAKSLAVDVIES